MPPRDNPFTTRRHGQYTPAQSIDESSSRRTTGDNLSRRSTSQYLNDPERPLMISESFLEEPGQYGETAASMVPYAGSSSHYRNDPVRAVNSPPPNHYIQRRESSYSNDANQSYHSNTSYTPQSQASYNNNYYNAQARAHQSGYAMPTVTGNVYAGKVTIRGRPSVLLGNLHDGPVAPRNMPSNLYLGETELEENNTANFIAGNASARALDERGFWNGSRRRRQQHGVYESEQQVPEDRWWESR